MPLNTKHIVRSLAWVSLGIATIMVLVAAIRTTNNTICNRISITILTDYNNDVLISTKDIEQLINAKGILHIQPIGSINIKQLEKKLCLNTWIANATVYIDNTTTLHIDVVQRIPIARIYTQAGNSYYIDDAFAIMPLSSTYTAHVPIITGIGTSNTLSKKDSALLTSVYTVIDYIQHKEFWQAQIQQINITNNANIELTPTIGNHTILLGDTTLLDSKFQKLFLFYKKVSTQVGFDKYKYINLQYNNQIVVSGEANTVTDSTLAIQVLQQLQAVKQDTVLQAIKGNDTAITSKPIITAMPKAKSVALNTKKPKAIMPKQPVVKVKQAPANKPIKITNTPSIKNSNPKPKTKLKQKI